MTIKQFIVGHKYIYLEVTKPEENEDLFPHGWNDDMDFALIPQVLTCQEAFETVATFLEQPKNSSRNLWNWSDVIFDWLDVTNMSEKKIQKILDDKKRRLIAERI